MQKQTRRKVYSTDEVQISGLAARQGAGLFRNLSALTSIILLTSCAQGLVEDIGSAAGVAGAGPVASSIGEGGESFEVTSPPEGAVLQEMAADGQDAVFANVQVNGQNEIAMIDIDSGEVSISDVADGEVLAEQEGMMPFPSAPMSREEVRRITQVFVSAATGSRGFGRAVLGDAKNRPFYINDDLETVNVLVAKMDWSFVAASAAAGAYYAVAQDLAATQIEVHCFDECGSWDIETFSLASGTEVKGLLAHQDRVFILLSQLSGVRVLALNASGELVQDELFGSYSDPQGLMAREDGFEFMAFREGDIWEGTAPERRIAHLDSDANLIGHQSLPAELQDSSFAFWKRQSETGHLQLLAEQPKKYLELSNSDQMSCYPACALEEGLEDLISPEETTIEIEAASMHGDSVIAKSANNLIFRFDTTQAN